MQKIVVALAKCISDNSRITSMHWCWVIRKGNQTFNRVFTCFPVAFGFWFIYKSVSSVSLNLFLPECYCVSSVPTSVPHKGLLLCIYLMAQKSITRVRNEGYVTEIFNRVLQGIKSDSYSLRNNQKSQHSFIK